MNRRKRRPTNDGGDALVLAADLDSLAKRLRKGEFTDLQGTFHLDELAEDVWVC
jgi:hypothetical protein